MKFAGTVLRLVVFGLLFAMAGIAAAQQAYPGKPIRFITPYAPGGSTEILARFLGQKLTESWGQQVLVDNRPGGNTIIGSEAMVKSPPDGYTILLVTSGHVINAHLLVTPYDAIKDFAPIATVAGGPFLLVVNPAVPANNLQEFIALAKAKPGQLNYASSGAGSSTHLATEYFNILAEVRMQHIPYKGGGPALVDLIGGQVQVSFNVPIALLPHVKSGKLRGIAITGEARMAALPQVPTFIEGGLPAYDMKNWYGVLAPAATPRPIIEKLSTEFGKILATQDSKEKLLAQGMEAFYSPSEQFGALMKADLARYGRVIKTANIKLEN
jgi:tripartite-type tricarboxylate transporter receptor subunit TctC